MIVKKAGCILINLKTKKIGLVFRKKTNDYSFPKGHLDIGETLEECAIRETEEEIGRICIIVPSKKKYILNYVDSLGCESEVHYYFAIDNGKSSKVFDADLVHEIVWVSFEDVESKLSYSDLKKFWNEIKFNVIELLEQEK